METELIKTVKGETMTKIFNECEVFSIRYFENLDLKDDELYNPSSNYKFRIRIRHSEKVNPNIMFEEVRFLTETKQPN